jgi:3-mercaptopyruvate sulfurtransferase SseA
MNINRKALFPLIFVVVGVVLIVASSFWFVQSSQTEPTPTIMPTLVVPTQPLRIPEPDIPRVGLAEAKTAYDSHQAVFVDVRAEENFQSGHIPEALNIPLDQLSTRYTELNSDDWIITYCT